MGRVGTGWDGFYYHISCKLVYHYPIDPVFPGSQSLAVGGWAFHMNPASYLKQKTTKTYRETKKDDHEKPKKKTKKNWTVGVIFSRTMILEKKKKTLKLCTSILCIERKTIFTICTILSILSCHNTTRILKKELTDGGIIVFFFPNKLFFSGAQPRPRWLCSAKNKIK